MKACIQHCCDAKDKKCNLAFMLSNTCYAVTCKNKESCVTMTAPPSSFHPQISMVREPSTVKGAEKIDKLIELPAPAGEEKKRESGEKDRKYVDENRENRQETRETERETCRKIIDKTFGESS